MSTLKELIKFMYTDKLDRDSENVEHLFVAADKYEIGALKSNCESVLIDKTDINNCVDYFRLAFLHGSKALKEKTLHLISSNFEKVKASPAFVELQNQSYSGPANLEILSHVFKNVLK